MSQHLSHNRSSYNITSATTVPPAITMFFLLFCRSCIRRNPELYDNKCEEDLMNDKNDSKVKSDEFYLCYRSLGIKIINPLHGVNVHVAQSHLQSLLITDVPTDVFVKDVFFFYSWHPYDAQKTGTGVLERFHNIKCKYKQIKNIIITI